MLAELDVVVFLKSHDDLRRTAERVFGVLKSQYSAGSSEDWGGDYYEALGLGFSAVVYANRGDLLDPEFESYPYGLEIVSDFWCVDLDQVDLEGPLSEFYARQLAFDLDVETATQILVETTEEFERFTILAYRRNPQYRIDQAPTTPKVVVIEEREARVFFEDEGEDEVASRFIGGEDEEEIEEEEL